MVPRSPINPHSFEGDNTMPTMEEKIADLERQIAAHKEELARLRSEPHKPPVGAKPWQPIDYTENMRMPPSAAWEMAKVVPDDLVRQIVGDSMRKAQPSPPAEPEPERGTGWVDEVKFPDRSREFELMDRVVESQVGGPNDTRKLK
jgi:hypothetical protein